MCNSILPQIWHFVFSTAGAVVGISSVISVSGGSILSNQLRGNRNPLAILDISPPLPSTRHAWFFIPFTVVQQKRYLSSTASMINGYHSNYTRLSDVTMGEVCHKQSLRLLWHPVLALQWWSSSLGFAPRTKNSPPRISEVIWSTSISKVHNMSEAASMVFSWRSL